MFLVVQGGSRGGGLLLVVQGGSRGGGLFLVVQGGSRGGGLFLVVQGGSRRTGRYGQGFITIQIQAEPSLISGFKVWPVHSLVSVYNVNPVAIAWLVLFNGANINMASL
ncbi:hypothetical protein DOJ70_23470 [Salmonella enterica subsp. enterica]|nr:hypothetical protein [Salmonella enterica subsp. enterica serovar Newport]